MKTYELIAPCHFGLEAVLKREIIDLGYDVTQVEDGRVTFLGDAEAICRGNIFLRTAERLLLKIGEFRAVTFEELFEKTRALPWEEYLPENGKFWVAKATSVKSKLFSPSDIQSIMKKAMVERMKQKYHREHFAEDGASYPLRVFFYKDRVTVCLDTTGDSLHKRGYRKMAGEAPISETLAAALVMLTPWRGDRIFLDPFCGSGTFPIEAAMMAAHIAPGVRRSFRSMEWEHLIPRQEWKAVRQEAKDLETLMIQTQIEGFDIDGELLKIAERNAKEAGVYELIRFQKKAVKDLRPGGDYGFIITNPPYGERIGEQETLPLLYQEFGEMFRSLPTWSAYMITAYEEAQRYFGQKAGKNRKIYNGMLKTYYYQYPGPKPPKFEKMQGKS